MAKRRAMSKQDTIEDEKRRLHMSAPALLNECKKNNKGKYPVPVQKYFPYFKPKTYLEVTKKQDNKAHFQKWLKDYESSKLMHQTNY